MTAAGDPAAAAAAAVTACVENGELGAVECTLSVAVVVASVPVLAPVAAIAAAAEEEEEEEEAVPSVVCCDADGPVPVIVQVNSF